MQIAIDTRITYYNSTGLTRYARGLIAALASLPFDDSLISLQNWRHKEPLVKHPRVRVENFFTPPHFRFEQYGLQLEEVFRSPPDVLHCVDFYAPFKKAKALVFTAQDLYFMRDPECMSAESYRHYRKFCTEVQRADHVICSSESTRADLLSYSGVAENRTSVVYPGFSFSHLEFDPEETKAVLQHFALPEEPLLFVGTIEPRKNVERLLGAYEMLWEQQKDVPPLCIIGKAGFGAQRFFERLARSPAAKSIVYVPAVSERELQVLYACAHMLLYPSLYEGFGFPIVEAFAAKTPVLTAQVSSMGEVAADAAVLVDPSSVEDIAAGMRVLLQDSALRKQCIERGCARLNDFSWEESAKKVRSVYVSVSGAV